MDGLRDFVTEWNKSGREGEILLDILYKWNLKRNDTNELAKQKQTQRLRIRTYGCSGWEWGWFGGRDSWGVWGRRVRSAIFKMDSQQGPTIEHMELCSLLCNNLDGRGVWGRMDICICIAESSWCSHETIKTVLIGYCSLLSHFSRVRLSATPWTTARQAPLSMGFSRKEYWSGLPFPSPVIKYEVSEVKTLSHVELFATPWTIAYQAPPSMGFSRQEYRRGLPFPSA